MYFNQDDDERDPFELFGDEVAEDSRGDIALQEFENTTEEPAVIEPQQPAKVKTGFSWAGFAGGLAALVWIAGAIGGPLSYFGVTAVLAMDPAMQAGLLALAFGPALLFWVSASAAGESLKTRYLTTELTRLSQQARFPTEAAELEAQRVSNTVKNEIESLNDAVSAALDRLAELETVAQRNANLFGEAINASRDNAAQLSYALKVERDAIVELNTDLKGQTEVIAHSVGRQVRLMREASKIVKTEVGAAEDALQSHLSSFAASAHEMGERTAAFHHAADSAAHATASLNGSMTEMLDGLTQATRLTETAKKSTAEAVLAANETASAVRETTRTAVQEAKRAAQLIRAETVALQDAAAETLAKLQDAAHAARMASEESQAAADYHAASIEKRLGALASAAGAKKVAAPAPRPVAQRPVERQPEPVMVREEVTTLHAAATAAVGRGSSRGRVDVAEPKRVFKGFGSWGNFMPQRDDGPTPTAANESAFELADFGSSTTRKDPDTELKSGAIDLVTDAGVDLGDILNASDLERIARNSRDGASARRRSVIDAAPGAVTRISRHVRRNAKAHDVAIAFRARPDLAKSEKKGEGSELVRAYLLIDAALG
ncbi:hypothetical protein [Terricaulis silvestris]|uniref:ATPase involved in DNA repair n=1 Tax=Terricaulis silvestris TaxID=2686094 RepID=A0A6I6MMF4_9CAUL|nr:hypothetical protein [Terricaulis silvestris]QGZ95859.1 hypothetical protein DSM104635_02712 [Terricaulis silvestris]